jgi:hypothetical protein
MALSDQPSKQVELIRRLQALRGWMIGFGLVAGLMSLTVAGVGGVGNPKNWASAFSAMAAAGFLRWAALPLAGVAGILLIAAAALHIFIERKKRES